VSVALTRARLGATATFALMGITAAVWTVRIPALSDKLHLDPGQLGTVMLCFGVGATIAMQAGRLVIGRTGSRRALIVALPATVALVAAIGLAPSYGWLLVTAPGLGAAFGVLDIGANAQVAVLERVTERHLMNGAHAGWSIGSVVGGGLGALTAYAGWGFTRAVVTAAVVCFPIAVGLTFTFLPDPPAARAAGTRPGRIPRVIYLVGAVTCASFIIEGSVADWAGLYLRNELGAREAVAAIAYPCFEAAMIIGRMAGDGVRRRVGSRVMLTIGGLGVVAGFAVVVGTPWWWLTFVGFAITGLAVSTVVPLTFSIAGALDPTGAGVAQAGAMGYGGILLGPVAIGYLANATSLRTGLLVTLALGGVVAVLARVVPTGSAAPAASREVELGERV
jgi:MFS family permease